MAQTLFGFQIGPTKDRLEDKEKTFALPTNDAFLYCWTDNKTNKIYVGAHKGTQDDGYICSSKIMLEQYKQRPDDFSRQVIAEGLCKDIFKLEKRILVSENVKCNEAYYNMNNGGGYWDFKLKAQTEEHKQKIRESKLGIKLPESHKNSIRNAMNRPDVKAKQKESHAGQTPWNKGLSNPYSRETVRLLSSRGINNKNALGHKQSDEHKRKISQAHMGHNHSRKTKILTPTGVFNSMTSAGSHFGVSRGTVRNWVRAKKPGWELA